MRKFKVLDHEDIDICNGLERTGDRFTHKWIGHTLEEMGNPSYALFGDREVVRLGTADGVFDAGATFPLDILEEVVQNSEEGYYEIPEEDSSYSAYEADDSADEYLSDDAFQPGDVVNFTLSSVWDGSVVKEACTSPGYEDAYVVDHPVQGRGTMRDYQMTLVERPLPAIVDEVQDDAVWKALDMATNKPYSMTFKVVPEVKDPDAPTVAELNAGIDISDFITGHAGYSINGEDVEDLVNHPDHYTGFSNGAEVIDITENLNFNRGNAVKYLARAGAKDPESEMQDVLKAQWYVNREVDRLLKAEEN